MTILDDRMDEFEKCIKLENKRYIPLEHIVTPEMALEYAGYSLFTGVWDVEVLLKALDKTINDFDADYVRSLYFRSPRFYSTLGAKSFVQSPQGFVQHPEVHSMEPEEYDEFIIDPVKFLAEKCVPRIYTALDKPEPYKSFALAKGMHASNRIFGAYNAGVGKILQQAQLKSVCAVSTEAPFDFMADLIRSFTGISTDVRRHKDKVKAACEAVLPVMINKGLAVAPGIERLVHIPLHMPPFLNEKVFKELWWPTFKELVEKLVAEGHYLYIFFEGDWSRYYEYLTDLPKKRIMGRFEYADAKLIKTTLGDMMCLLGFYPLTLLANGTKEVCIDKAKEYIDILAPGGGYVFNFDKITTSASDVKAENVHAVNKTVREYGKY